MPLSKLHRIESFSLYRSRLYARDISLVHVANILRQDQVIEYFSSIRFAESTYNFVLLSYRQIDAYAEHEEGLKDIY